MFWISHRGESIDAPENTLDAFKLSLDRNTSGMECDIRLTADKKLVVCHDSDTKRTCGGASMKIEESTYDELQKLCANNNKPGFENARIPLFGETIQHLGNDRLYFIEIKEDDPNVIDALVEELDKAQLPPEKVVMISFKNNIVKLYKQRFPNRKAYFLANFLVSQDGTWWPSVDRLIEELNEMGADGVDIRANFTFLNQEYVDKVKAAGFEFSVWTVDDPATAKRCIDIGINIITSNCAAHIRDSLAQS